MLPYSRGLILDNTHNYGIMKTETVFGFGPPQQNSYGNNSFNATEPLEWIFTDGNIQERSLQDTLLPRKVPKSVSKTNKNTSSREKKLKKKGKESTKKRKSKKINKCIIKFMKGGQQGGQHESQEYKGKKRRRRRGGGNKIGKMQKKYMVPVILGLLAAKSLLIPIALKALAFMSAKGLMMGFFSTVLASVISLKGMFNYPHESSKRNDDAKTQVEIIQIPSKSEDHVYYDDHHYKRGDYIPVYPINSIPVPDQIVYDNNVIKKKRLKSSAEVERLENNKMMNKNTLGSHGNNLRFH